MSAQSLRWAAHGNVYFSFETVVKDNRDTHRLAANDLVIKKRGVCDGIGFQWTC